MRKSHVGKSLVASDGIFGKMLSDDKTHKRVMQFCGKRFVVTGNESIAPTPKVGILLPCCLSGSRGQFKCFVYDIPE